MQVANEGGRGHPCLHCVPRLHGFAGVVLAADLGLAGSGGRGGRGVFFLGETVARVFQFNLLILVCHDAALGFDAGYG